MYVEGQQNLSCTQRQYKVNVANSILVIIQHLIFFDAIGISLPHTLHPHGSQTPTMHGFADGSHMGEQETVSHPPTLPTTCGTNHMEIGTHTFMS